jgi:hypothetical protein
MVPPRLEQSRIIAINFSITRGFMEDKAMLSREV